MSNVLRLAEAIAWRDAREKFVFVSNSIAQFVSADVRHYVIWDMLQKSHAATSAWNTERRFRLGLYTGWRIGWQSRHALYRCVPPEEKSASRWSTVANVTAYCFLSISMGRIARENWWLCRSFYSCHSHVVFRYTTAETPLTSVETTRMTSSNDVTIKDVVLNPNGLLALAWESKSSRSAKYYQLQIYDQANHQLIFQRFIDGRQRAMEIDLSPYLSNSPVTTVVCLNIRQKRSCRTVAFQPDTNVIKSASLALSSNKQNNDQFVYLIGGILLGAILVCSILIIVCYCRLCNDADERNSSPTCAEKSSRPFYYHPLNVISYPPQPSNNTSECSLHSSIDTASQLVNDPYHVYQQIPSAHNCQIHSTRTHVVVWAKALFIFPWTSQPMYDFIVRIIKRTFW